MSHTLQRKLNEKVESASGKRANALRVEDAIAGGYKSASRTVIAQIQLRIKARRCAANLAMVVNFRATEDVSELKIPFQKLLW